MNYRKYKIRTCRWLNKCNLCLTDIVSGEKYYDGGSSRRAHLICNDVTGAVDFVKWMRGRGEFYKRLPIKVYKDGEPYFQSQGAEVSMKSFLLSEFLRNKETKNELSRNN